MNTIHKTGEKRAFFSTTSNLPWFPFSPECTTSASSKGHATELGLQRQEDINRFHKLELFLSTDTEVSSMLIIARTSILLFTTPVTPLHLQLEQKPHTHIRQQNTFPPPAKDCTCIHSRNIHLHVGWHDFYHAASRPARAVLNAGVVSIMVHVNNMLCVFHYL